MIAKYESFQFKTECLLSRSLEFTYIYEKPKSIFQIIIIVRNKVLNLRVNKIKNKRRFECT